MISARTRMEHELELLLEVADPGVWSATTEQRDFLTRVLRRHIARSEKRNRHAPVRDLPTAALATVPGADITMRKDAAAAAGLLLAAANLELAVARSAGDADALRTVKISGISGYRSATRQEQLWRGYFQNKYYNNTRAAREKLTGGPHGEAAVDFMVQYVGARIAAPGFSNHQAGIAIDFQQHRTKGAAIKNSTNQAQVARWQGTWFFKWLNERANAARFGFTPYSKEPWHWEYNPTLNPIRNKEFDDSSAASAAPTEQEIDLGFTRGTITQRDKQFDGEKGRAFKELVVKTADKVAINPGLLAAHLLAEHGDRSAYLQTTGEIDSYTFLGADYAAEFFQIKSDGSFLTSSDGTLKPKTAIAKLIPAIKEIRATPGETHLNDAPGSKAKLVTDIIIPAKQGALLSAIYLKHKEHRVRSIMADQKINFDSLKPEVRFAWTRLAINPGAKRPATQLKEMGNKPEKVLQKTGPQDQDRRRPRRGATRVAAQAIHLSKSVFGRTP